MKKRSRTIYDDSLPRIFFRAGADVFVFLLIGCAVLYLFLWNSTYGLSDRMMLLALCLAVTVLVSYGPAAISVCRIRAIESALGIRWKDRTDCRRPMEERDWFLTYDRGGFILCHRAYIGHILATKTKEEHSLHGSGKVYQVLFQDINGKKHLYKFSSSTASKNFREWYAKVPPTSSNEEELNSLL